MKKAFKIFVLVFLLASQVVFAQSDSEKADALYNRAQRFYLNKNYQKAIPLYEESYKYKPNKDIPANAGISYKHINKYQKALLWYKIGIEKFNDKKSVLDLAILYEKNLHNTNAAIKYYTKAFEMGDTDGGVGLGLLYETIKNYQNAIKWYKKAIEKSDIGARKNLGLLYHDQHDNLNSAVYMMGMIGHPYTRERIIGILRNNWKINEKTLLKAYILQKKLIPNPYLDSEFEALIPAPHRNRRGIGR